MRRGWTLVAVLLATLTLVPAAGAGNHYRSEHRLQRATHGVRVRCYRPTVPVSNADGALVPAPYGFAIGLNNSLCKRIERSLADWTAVLRNPSPYVYAWFVFAYEYAASQGNTTKNKAGCHALGYLVGLVRRAGLTKPSSAATRLHRDAKRLVRNTYNC